MTRSPVMAMPCEDENLVDYFIVATKRLDGSSAQLSFVYPPIDDDPEETEFCENVTMFTFPHGYVMSWDGHSLPPPPAHNLFTLTDAQGDHLYGASLSFFETANNAKTHAKSLCVLTRRPFYSQMLRYLEELLLLGLTQQALSTASSKPDAVEKALCNLFHEVPVPYRGLAVQLQIAELEIFLERPPFLDFPYEMDTELMMYTFMLIDPKVLQQLYHHVLLEHRVLVVGNDSVLVTAVVETLKSLVFPLTWLHVVIPNIPDSLDLSTLLDAPVPFLAGAHTGQLQHVAIPSNVVKYDLSESRLVVPSGANNNHQAHQMDLESVVLPPLPDVSTRLLQKLSTTRLADLHTQKKDLQQKLWDRRIQLQKCCMATSTASTVSGNGSGVPMISPKNFFLVKQSLVHKKMMKLYLEVIATMLQDFAQCVSHHSKDFESAKFIDKKHAASKPFYQAFTETAQFQSFITQHNEYTAGHLALEDAMKFHYVHKTLLSTERITGNQAEASVAVAMALTKTFVAHAPQTTSEKTSTGKSEAVDTKTRLDVVFPALDLDAFGEPRQIQFPSMATDAVHSSLGTFISPSGSSSRRASKDTSDWMQSFMRTVPLPSAFMRSDRLTSSSSSSSSGHNNNNNSNSSSTSERSMLSIFGSSSASPAVPTPAPFKRSRTIDRLKNASPFYRTMTQKALDSTLSSLASAASSMGSNSSSSHSQSRPSTVVRSIWLITTGSCKCRDRVVLLTQKLVEQLQLKCSKTAPQVTDAYCELIHALAACNHPSEAKAVFEECLSGSALVSLASIATLPHFWKPFSALLRCYIANGLVQRAFDLLVSVEIEEEQLLDPSLGVLQFTAQVIGAEREVMVERLYVTFSCGNLGMCLAPRATSSSQDNSGAGCELISFEGDPETSLEHSTGLRVHDVIETINGEFVLHHAFQDIITLLKQGSRPMTVTFVRGLDRLDMVCGPGGGVDGIRRSSSSASASSLSSTSAVVDGKNAAVVGSSSKSTPRRDLCDRFGLLPSRGIRVTALADCESCGTRLNLTQVQSGWTTNDANDYTTRCYSCSHRFVPRLCVMLGVMTVLYQPTRTGATAGRALLPHGAKVEQFEYLSMAVIRKELSNLAQKIPLTLLSMKDLRDRNPRIYWNIVVKLLSLDVPLDFMELPDTTKSTEEPTEKDGGKPSVTPAAASKDAEELRALGDMVMKRAERIQSDNPSQKMEDVLSSVFKALEQQTKAEVQAKLSGKATNTVPGRKRWSLLRSLQSNSPTTSPRAVVTPTSTSTVVLKRGPSQENDRSGSDDERETDFEDMRSSRTLSVTESLVHDDVAPHEIVRTKTPAPSRGSKFMPSLAAAAPFRRSIARTGTSSQ